ncbi:MAG: TIGR00730 family Rossman fold protein, partial [Nitrospinae bacterium]|nr:TIGR00730 family Rossman fold protein [Nitrospinota bacterium]
MKAMKTVCVFCASSRSVGQVYIEAAMELGRLMGRDGIDLVYGGAAIGLMGAVAKGV